MASNSCLIPAKLAAGLLTGSVGILSDAIHSLMDLIASVIAFASVRKANAPADASRRYGHEKLGRPRGRCTGPPAPAGRCVHRIRSCPPADRGGSVASVDAGIAVAAVAAAINVVVSWYLSQAGRTTGSAALDANAADLRTDACVSMGVLVAVSYCRHRPGLDRSDRRSRGRRGAEHHRGSNLGGRQSTPPGP